MAQRAVRRGIAVSMNDGRELASIRRFPYVFSIFRLLWFGFACTVFFGAQYLLRYVCSARNTPRNQYGGRRKQAKRSLVERFLTAYHLARK